MHIALDVREACHEQRTGKGRWTRAFTDELLRRETVVTLVTDAPLPTAWEHMRLVHPDRVHVMRFAPGLRWHVRCALWLRSARDIDVYVSTVSFIVPFLVGSKKKVIPIIHDLIAFQDETHERRAARIERWMLPRTLRKAHRICLISEATKRDLLVRFPFVDPRNVSVILAAAVSTFPLVHRSDGRTILSIGTLSPRKNQLRLIEAFARLPEPLRSHHRLVLVGGRGWDDDGIVSRAREVPGVECLGFCSDAETERLLSDAHIFAYPSLYEGFGLPVLDAMRLGIPVLCSDHGSLAEVAGDAALLIEPESIESIRDGLAGLLTDASQRERLSVVGPKRAALFSWRRTVDLFFTAMDSHPA